MVRFRKNQKVELFRKPDLYFIIMIKLALVNPQFPKDVAFPVREKDIGFLEALNKEELGKKISFLTKRKIRPYRKDNAEYFWEYANSVVEIFSSIFAQIDKEAFKKNFLTLMLYRDRRLQKVLNTDYGSKKNFLDSFLHVIEDYLYPGEAFQQPNPLPTVVTSNLMCTIYFYMTQTAEMVVPDNMIPYLLPIVKGEGNEKEAAH